MNNTKFKQTEIGLIPEDWDIKCISDIGKVVTGKTPKTEKNENFGDKYPFITPRDLKSQKFIFNTERYLSEIGKNSVKNCLISEKSICISCIGSDMGKVVMTTQESITNQQINAIIPYMSPDFIYYVLLNMSSEIKFIGKQSTAVPILNKSQFSKKKIAIPQNSKEIEQIVKVLSDLDSKIELYQQMNKTLEEIGKTVFKRWFVDFEFPNEQGNPYKSSGGEMVYNEKLKKEIPKGWETTKLDKLISRNKIKVDNYDLWADKSIIDLSNMPQKSISLDQWDLGGKFETNIFELNKFDILYGSIRPYFGKAGVSPINGVVTGSVFSFLPEDSNYYSYTLFLISSSDFIDYTINYSQGTKMPIISWSDFINYDCVIPNDNKLIIRFNELLYPLISLIVENIQENKKLAETRDLLLPKLMSGKIRVKYE